MIPVQAPDKGRPVPLSQEKLEKLAQLLDEYMFGRMSEDILAEALQLVRHNREYEK